MTRLRARGAPARGRTGTGRRRSPGSRPRRAGVGWAGTRSTRLVRDFADIGAACRRPQRCRVLLVDESSIRRRDRYVTVIVEADTEVGAPTGGG